MSSDKVVEFLGVFSFPHGCIILDPFTRDFTNTDVVQGAKEDSRECSIQLHKACKEQAELLMSKSPDIIIFSTPHGLRLKDNFLFLRNHKAEGSADWQTEWTDFIGTMDIASDVSKDCVVKLQLLSNPVELLAVGNFTEDKLPLRWGEVVPWWFIQQAANRSGSKLPLVIYIGQPFLTVECGIQKYVKFGQHLMALISTDAGFKSKRVAVVISGDLAHHHSSSPTSRYDFHPDAVPFDNIMKLWAALNISTTLDLEEGNKLLQSASELEEKAGSCGFTGWLMTQGIFCEALKQKYSFQAQVLNYSVPTYYGMMVNNWIALRKE